MATESAAAAAATAVEAASLLGSTTGEYVYISANSDYLDSDGYYISPKFDSYAIELDTLDVLLTIAALSSGEVGIIYEVFIDEINENQIVLFYTLSDSDNPTVTNLGETGYEYQYYTYDSAEELALQEKYGGPENPESLIEGLIETLSISVATVAVNAEYTFKKVKYDDLDYDNLSSFKKDEEAQAISVTTTFVSEPY